MKLRDYGNFENPTTAFGYKLLSETDILILIDKMETQLRPALENAIHILHSPLEATEYLRHFVSKSLAGTKLADAVEGVNITIQEGVQARMIRFTLAAQAAILDIDIDSI